MLAESPIERVTVYRTGAVVTRVVTAKSPHGAVEIVGLPLSLHDDSVRIRVLTDGIRAGAPSVGLHARARADLPPTPDLDRLRELRRQEQRAALRREALDVEVALLESVEVPARPEPEEGTAPPVSPMAARVALDRFTHQAIEARLAEIRSLDQALRDQRREISALDDALRRAGQTHLADRQTVSKSLRIPLTGHAPEVRIELDYFVPGARWAPTYQCHVDTRTGRTELHRRAVVSQATGEDWSRVSLSLSTALPQRFANLPELSSKRIGKAQPALPTPGFRPAPMGARALFADFDRGPKRLPVRSSSHRVLHLPPPPSCPPLDSAMHNRNQEFEESFLEDCDDEASTPMAFGASAAMEMPAPAPPLRSAPAPKSAASPPGARRRSAKRKKSAPREEATAVANRPPTFGSLRLAPPDSPQRGRLTPASTLDEYNRSLHQRGLTLDGDLGRLLEAATARAESIRSLALPDGTHAVNPGGFDYTSTTEHPVDVPDAASFHSIALATLETHADLTYVVVPRVDVNVFRVADIRNPSPAPLLPGPVEVYVGGRFVLASQLPLVPPRGSFAMGLGVEASIRCARNTRYQESRSGSAVVAMNELHHHIHIELRNQLDRPVVAEIRERLPVPAPDAEVAVEEVEITPPWEPWDQRRVGGSRIHGGRVWKTTVDAGAAVELEAHYVVKIYANNELVGGNRRES